MKNRKRTATYILIGLIVPLIIGFGACSPPEHYEGTYVAVNEAGPPHEPTVIELKEDSQGICRTEEQEVAFRWSVHNHEIRLHTKQGGILQGKIDRNTLTLNMPGEKLVVFKRQHTY
ncbi:MAG TPA: hypothetical protein PKM59_08865 [Thermodesulfobacteriota bacterium]|nr:hypothetical protein [Deltaproteobacteria bacterium]HNR13409.1 hypothetical protein [Thermodesulfobacteriota bacterium]HNU72275.1 hypothetical protein [Thermodesulfobacteriota bacterium]